MNDAKAEAYERAARAVVQAVYDYHKEPIVRATEDMVPTEMMSIASALLRAAKARSESLDATRQPMRP